MPISAIPSNRVTSRNACEGQLKVEINLFRKDYLEKKNRTPLILADAGDVRVKMLWRSVNGQIMDKTFLTLVVYLD